MQCERCNQKRTTRAYAERQGDKPFEEARELEDVSVALFGGMSPLFLREKYLPPLPLSGLFPKPIEQERPCPLCGATPSELLQEGLMGCPTCYATLTEGAARMLGLTDTHGEYPGRAPAGIRARREAAQRLRGLQDQLKAVIEKQEYERAAELRDEIRALAAAL